MHLLLFCGAFFLWETLPRHTTSPVLRANSVPNGKLFLKIAVNHCQFKGYEKSVDSPKNNARHHRYCKIKQGVYYSKTKWMILQ